MILRGDLKRPNPAPKSLQDVCLEAGGVTPFGDQMIRLCRAEDRITKAAGEWNTWDENLSVEERGGLGVSVIQKMLRDRQDVINGARITGFPEEDIRKMTAEMTGMIEEVMQECLNRHPTSVFTGMTEVEVYPNEGWILEKWKPADAFGPPSEWYKYTFQGVASLGPYPTFGIYESFAGPSPDLPTEDDIRLAIHRHFEELDSRPKSPQYLVAQMMSAREERNRKKRAERKADIEAALKDGPAGLTNRISLGAGRVLTELAESIGIRSHVGN